MKKTEKNIKSLKDFKRNRRRKEIREFFEQLRYFFKENIFPYLITAIIVVILGSAIYWSLDSWFKVGELEAINRVQEERIEELESKREELESDNLDLIRNNSYLQTKLQSFYNRVGNTKISDEKIPGLENKTVLEFESKDFPISNYQFNGLEESQKNPVLLKATEMDEQIYLILYLQKEIFDARKCFKFETFDENGKELELIITEEGKLFIPLIKETTVSLKLSNQIDESESYLSFKLEKN